MQHRDRIGCGGSEKKVGDSKKEENRQLKASNWDRMAKLTDWSGTYRLNVLVLLQEDSKTTFNKKLVAHFFSVGIFFFLFLFFFVFVFYYSNKTQGAQKATGFNIFAAISTAAQHKVNAEKGNSY